MALTLDSLAARASANVATFIGVTAASLIGRPLDAILLPDAVHALRNRLTTLPGSDAVNRIFQTTLTTEGGPFDIALHISGGQIVVEAQPSMVGQVEAASLVRSTIGRLDQIGTLSSPA